MLVFLETVQGRHWLPLSDEIGRSSPRHVQMTSGSITAGWILVDASVFLLGESWLLPASLVRPTLFVFAAR